MKKKSVSFKEMYDIVGETLKSIYKLLNNNLNFKLASICKFK